MTMFLANGQAALLTSSAQLAMLTFAFAFGLDPFRYFVFKELALAMSSF